MNEPNKTGKRYGWPIRLAVTLAVSAVFEALRIALSGEDSFEVAVLIISIVPIFWGLYAWVTAVGIGERIVGWLALASALWFVFVNIVWNCAILRK